MIPVKIGSKRISEDSPMSLESIVDWFDHHKVSFYTLGWSYLRNQKQMEELFYLVILKIHKELPRFKRETSFDRWITSIFIHTCRELSADSSLKASEESEQRKDVFKALDQLKESEKEAMVLTYVIGISLEESAQFLKVSVEEMKARLFSGIQSLREKSGYGSHFDGCKEYHQLYIGYLERTLDRPEKVDFEMHVHHCQNCQEDLATFQEVMLNMLELTEMVGDFHMPSGFMKKIKAKLAEKEKHRQLRARKLKKIGLVSASVIVMLICTGFLTGWFFDLYYSWTEEDQELRQYLQHNLGERLNLEAESNGVKITIKSVIADDIQTLLFYEIEDTNEDNQYTMTYQNGVWIENENEIMNINAHPKYYPPAQNNKEKNVYQGKISLLPLTAENGTIKLKVTRLQKLIHDPSNLVSYRGYVGSEYETGEWNFEIPVTKRPSIEYSLDKEIEIEGIPVQFNKLTIAPTTTILHYDIHNVQLEKRLESVNFESLEVNMKKVKTDPFGSSYVDPQQGMNEDGLQAHFDSLFKEKAKEVKVQFGSIYLRIEDHKTIEIDASKEEPQLFEYAGSTISIDKVEVGTPSKVVLSDHQIKNRQYDSFHFRIIAEDEMEVSSMGNRTEAVIVDKSGKEYDMNQPPVPFVELEWPRFFITVQNIELYDNNSGEKVVPKRLEIYGYNTTKYVDDVVEILVN
ncbi:DUF4179 domain-containing protein [Cytobacillus solani]|uniref:DUF4179 domain-containing protein n=1 Tax=Cytobacillus solani TaxID=1637975 RepID=UPI002079DAE4|nr:DUF4179 domain-containing protein [Cytobacillus solani]USK56122.1 DUF4179 domain-containing protein [Cytobacillus solani]